MKSLLLILFLIFLSTQQSCLRCNVCLANNTCTECQPQYQLNNLGVCALYTPIEGCLVYNATSTKCQSCNTSMLLLNGRC